MLRNGRVNAPGLATVAALATLIAAGCASQNQTAATAGSTNGAADASMSATHASAPVVLTGAAFLADGEAPRLLLSGEGALAPTVYARDEGRRIVVDLPNVVASPGLEPPRVDGTVLSQVAMKSFTELGVAHLQFELTARTPLDTRIGTEPGSSAMAVSFLRVSPPDAIAPAASEVTAEAKLPEPLPIKVETLPTRSEPPAVESAASPRPSGEPIALVSHAPKGHAATRLTAVAAKSGRGGTQVTLAGDGPFAYEAFSLTDPPRYVVDLRGVTNAARKRLQDVHAGSVARVRVSQFKTEPEPVTRVVFDLAEGTVPSIAESGAGLSLVFGKAGEPARSPEAREAVPAIQVASAAEPATVPVKPTIEEPAKASPQPIEPVTVAASVPASGSYEKHETDDPSESVVKEAPAPSPVAEVRPTQEKPERLPVETAAVKAEPAAAEAPKLENPPAAVSVDRSGSAAAASVDRSGSAAAASDTHSAAPLAPSAPVQSAAAPVTPIAPVEKAAPQIVAASPEVRIAPHAEEPPAPVRSARKSKAPTAEDRALIEAAEALLQQPEASQRAKDLAAPFESKAIGTSEKVYTGEPISLNLKDADIKDTLQKFSELTGLNIVIDPNVRGTVTVSLTDIPWDQALELILKINGLGYVLEGNVMRIATLGRLTQEEHTRIELLKAQDQARPVKTVIQKLSYATGNEAATVARKVMSARGDIFVDDRSNTLIIKELPDYLPTVLDLIKNLDTPTPQVMIEARIVEATRTFSRSLGVDWSFTAAADAAHGNTTGLIFPNSVNVGGQVSLPAGNPLLNFGVANVLNTFRLDFALSAAEARGLVKIISSPRVQTQTNQSAQIQSGFQIPIQTTVNNTTSVLYIDATLRLQVTPQITAEGTVIMQINLQKREPAVALTLAGSQNVPLLTRDARTKLMVKDGGTAVIGGIFKLTSNNGQNMVPGLWKIPLLGNLFRNKIESENTDELMIFITPRIMK